MKQKLCFIICVLFFLAASGQKENNILKKKTIVLSKNDLIGFGYTDNDGKPDSTKQPISSKSDAIGFIRNIEEKVKGLGDLKEYIIEYLNNLNDRNKEHTVILFRHPLNLAKVFKGVPADLVKAEKEYGSACASLKQTNLLLKGIDDKISDTMKSVTNINEKGESTIEISKLKPELVKEYNNLVQLKANLLNTKKELESKLSELKTTYQSALSEIVEDDKIETYVLTKEGKDWSEYLLNKRKILVVMVGGTKDLVKANIKINNKPSQFQTDLNELFQVAKALNIMPKDASQSDCSLGNEKGTQELPVTFLLLDEDKIKTPSSLEFTFEGKQDKYNFDIHEKTKLGIKIGFSGALLDRKNFKIDSSNRLTIQLDSAKKEELKSNLMVLFEFIPWGRDNDRLEPVWAKNKDVKLFSIERFGLVVGVKLAKDPLQTIYGGISYSLSREAQLNFGIGFYSTPKDVKDLPTSVNANLDYLKENAERKLEPKIFAGISFSPGQLGRSLGLIK